MPKKTTRAARTSQAQRSKEEQWRRRMAGQAQRGAGAIAEREFADVETDAMEGTVSIESESVQPRERPRMAATPQSRTQASAPTSGQRLAVTAARAARSRLAVNTLSIEDEMRYVRSDIRRLIILTAICLAVIIVLTFVIPR